MNNQWMTIIICMIVALSCCLESHPESDGAPSPQAIYSIHTPWQSLLGVGATSIGPMALFGGGFTPEYDVATNLLSVMTFHKESNSVSFSEAGLSAARAYMTAHKHGCLAVFVGMSANVATFSL